jgi:hypothetical protein
MIDKYPLGSFSAATAPLEGLLGGIAQKRSKISGLKGLGFSEDEAKSVSKSSRTYV